jgi:hypothetical protein
MRARIALTLMILATFAAGQYVGNAAEPASETGDEPSAAAHAEATDDDGKGDEKPLTIDDIMRYTMTRHLVKKVAKKQATPKEQQRLVELFKTLAKLEPPKGSPESWEEKTTALVVAAEEIAAGKPSHQALMKAANCAACHKAHRP